MRRSPIRSPITIHRGRGTAEAVAQMDEAGRRDLMAVARGLAVHEMMKS